MAQRANDRRCQADRVRLRPPALLNPEHVAVSTVAAARCASDPVHCSRSKSIPRSKGLKYIWIAHNNFGDEAMEVGHYGPPSSTLSRRNVPRGAGVATRSADPGPEPHGERDDVPHVDPGATMAIILNNAVQTAPYYVRVRISVCASCGASTLTFHMPFLPLVMLREALVIALMTLVTCTVREPLILLILFCDSLSVLQFLQ
jgi:hypothetical protein